MGMIAATFLLSFLTIGFIGSLQQLMHILDHDIEGKNPSPWRTELVYTLYFAGVTTFVFVMSMHATSTDQLLWINGALVLMMSYTDAVKTRLNIILPLILTVGLFFLITQTFSYWLILTLTIGILLLLTERQWFFPFDKHPLVVLSVKAVVGAISWAGLKAALDLKTQQSIMMYVVYLLVTALVYWFMVLLRREHITNVDTARSLLYDNLTNAHSWLSFKRDADDYFDNYHELSMIAMDIDNFKQINDTYGHLVGNAVLVQFTKRLREILAQQTSGAKLYRTGGEEFTILYPGVTREAVKQTAEKLQKAVRHLLIETETGEQIRVTVSMGVDCRRGSDKKAIEIFNRADRCLYISKRNGKNQISIGEDG